METQGTKGVLSCRAQKNVSCPDLGRCPRRHKRELAKDIFKAIFEPNFRNANVTRDKKRDKIFCVFSHHGGRHPLFPTHTKRTLFSSGTSWSIQSDRSIRSNFSPTRIGRVSRGNASSPAEGEDESRTATRTMRVPPSRLLPKLLRRSLSDEGSLLHHEHACGDGFDLAEDVRRQENRVIVLEGRQNSSYFDNLIGIEAARGLIEEKYGNPRSASAIPTRCFVPFERSPTGTFATSRTATASMTRSTSFFFLRRSTPLRSARNDKYSITLISGRSGQLPACSQSTLSRAPDPQPCRCPRS